MNRLLLPMMMLALSCQRYDFEPVQSLTLSQTNITTLKYGTNLRPNIVVLLDRSGSMGQPIDTMNPACPAGCGLSACPAQCPTRISEVRGAMNQFFTGSARNLARWGLAVFPERAQFEQCSASASFLEPLPAPSLDDSPAASWALGADEVNARLQSVAVGGGTPTVGSLAFLRQTPGLTDDNDQRADFVLLLTDGLPNCSASNPNNVCSDTSAGQQAACACTVSDCTSAGVCSLGCLDTSAPAEVKALRDLGLFTLVVGFGADTAASGAAAVLDQMARQGGFPRACKSSADCASPDACQRDGLCARAYYQASSAAELTQALRRILDSLTPEACTVQLPTSTQVDAAISVVVDGTVLQASADTWTWSGSDRKILLTGALCSRIRAATPADAVQIVVRVTEHL